MSFYFERTQMGSNHTHSSMMQGAQEGENDDDQSGNPSLNRSVSFKGNFTQSTIMSMRESAESSQDVSGGRKKPSTMESPRRPDVKHTITSHHPVHEDTGAASSEKKPFWRRIITTGITFNHKKKEEVKKDKKVSDKDEKKWSKVKSDGILIENRNKSKVHAEQKTQTLDLDTDNLEKDLRIYFSSLKAASSILKLEDRMLAVVKLYMKEKEIDKWLFDQLVTEPKVAFVMSELLTEYGEMARVKFRGKKEEYCSYCGQRLYTVVHDALARSLFTQEKPIPRHLRELLQTLNYETKRQFPDAPSELIVCRLFFSRFIIPAFFEKVRSQEEVAVCREICKAMHGHLQTLDTVPDALAPLFILDIDQIRHASLTHLSSLQDTSVGTIFRGESDEEKLVKRWADYFGREWIHTVIVNNKKLKLKIDELLIEFEEVYENNYSQVPEKVRSEWGEQLFLVAVDSIVKNQPPMPAEFRQLIQVVNSDIKKRFSTLDSEHTVCVMLFLRFFCPPMLISGEGSLRQVSAHERVSVVKCMQYYIANDLKHLPKQLDTMFV
jgi:hypothetical protein